LQSAITITTSDGKERIGQEEGKRGKAGEGERKGRGDGGTL